MPKRKRLLFILSSQFGYHTDTLMYCKYIDKTEFEVHYIGFDLGLDKIVIEGIQTHYVPCNSNKMLRYLVYIKYIIRLKKSIKFDFVFHIHTKLSFPIRLVFLNCNYNFDIRTGDISDSSIKQKLNNLKITLLSMFCKNVSVISSGLADKLNLKSYHLLPLGGEINYCDQKDYQSLRLLYVGTLSKRRLEDTIAGISDFQNKYKNISIRYDIVGSGSENDISILKNHISNYHLTNTVFLHGQVKYIELPKYYNASNIGIVYIPQKDYYEYQPSTKLYEYLLAGMPVIATNTFENRKEISNIKYGVICQDNPNSFSNALKVIQENLFKFESSQIIGDKKENSWENIVNKNLEPYIRKIINK